MLSVANVMNIILAAAASISVVAVPDPSPAKSPAALSVVFYDETAFNGEFYIPKDLPVARCFTLPDNWLHRAESVKIGAERSCTFYKFPACAGGGTRLVGSVSTLPGGLLDNLDSMICTLSKP